MYKWPEHFVLQYFLEVALFPGVASCLWWLYVIVTTLFQRNIYSCLFNLSVNEYRKCTVCRNNVYICLFLFFSEFSNGIPIPFIPHGIVGGHGDFIESSPVIILQICQPAPFQVVFTCSSTKKPTIKREIWSTRWRSQAGFNLLSEVHKTKLSLYLCTFL